MIQKGSGPNGIILAGEFFCEEAGGVAFAGGGYLLGGTLGNDHAAAATAFGADVNDPVSLPCCAQ